MNVEWKMRPYLGVLPLVLSARKSAFSAPRIWTVEAGYLARLVSEPACETRARRDSSVSAFSAPTRWRFFVFFVCCESSFCLK